MIKFIQNRLKLTDRVTIKTDKDMILYKGFVSDIPYKLIAKPSFVSASISNNDITIIVTCYWL